MTINTTKEYHQVRNNDDRANTKNMGYWKDHTFTYRQGPRGSQGTKMSPKRDIQRNRRELVAKGYLIFS